MSIIRGGMPDTVLTETVESFGTGSSAMRLLVATDVASEGVNLHHQCHDVIHYDLPWSIITLIQRNGRVDRFGQKHPPVIRYLMVESEQGLLRGDGEIFRRLVEKVEEINRSTRTGESVLKLYDARKEEEYVALGLVRGDVNVLDRASPQSEESAELEATLLAAAKQGHEDFLAFLTGQNEAPQTPVRETAADNSRVRLMSDEQFLERGYATLARTLEHEDFPPLEKTPQQFILDPPRQLRRRLGAEGDVMFGATVIPQEAWPEDGRLYLTARVERVESAIQAALARQGQWSRSCCSPNSIRCSSGWASG